jgi:hypothetical protein
MQKWNFYGFHRGQASSLASHQTKQISDGEKELLKKERQIALVAANLFSLEVFNTRYTIRFFI